MNPNDFIPLFELIEPETLVLICADLERTKQRRPDKMIQCHRRIMGLAQFALQDKVGDEADKMIDAEPAK